MGRTEETTHLRGLARALTASYISHAAPRAVLLAGSAATGDADRYSDLDLLLYYDRVPAEESLAAAPRELGAGDYRGTSWSDESGEQDAEGLGERFRLDGIECQVGHVSIGAFEREIERLVVDLELNEELFKIMCGLFEGLPLHGEALIEGWREKAAYTEELQRATIEKRWRFFPWWYFQDRLRSRDANVWRYEMLAQSVYSLVGVLAALNRVYFSTLEFKRTGRFLSALEHAPPNAADRINALFELDEPSSTAELERLVAETEALVAERFPDLDLSLERGGKSTPPGEREQPWTPRELPVGPKPA